MRFALYVTLLVLLIPIIFSRPFFGLCVYYVVSLLQPKYLCWRPDFQDAFLVGIPMIMGAVAFGIQRSEPIAVREQGTGKLLSVGRRISRGPLMLPCWSVLLFAMLIGYIAIARVFMPYNLELTSYQFRGLCKVLLVAALTTGLVAGPRQFRILFIVIALATAFWAIKGGLKVMVLGPHQVYGKTYDNNYFALTSVMVLPMVFYFGMTVQHARWRTFLLVCSALICLGIIGSRSRAGFVAFGVLLVCMAWSSRHRFKALAAVTVVATVTAFMSGPEIVERMNSIFTYSEDKSASSRFFTWAVAWELFVQHPLIGVGFNNFEIAKDTLMGGHKAAHNIFLQNLSELGILGSPIWLAIIFGSMFGLFRLMRRGRRLPADMRWVYYCARGLLLGLLGFCIHGIFHNEEYIELLFVMIALAATLHAVADRQWYELQLQAELAQQGVPAGDMKPAATPSPVVASVPETGTWRPRSLSEYLQRNRRPDPQM